MRAKKDKVPPPFDPNLDPAIYGRRPNRAISSQGEDDPKLQRLQKVLANAGVASRRECEKLIISGRVKVNGIVERTLGVKVNPEEVMLHVDGQPVLLDDRQVTIVLNKPVGIESTMAESRKSLLQFTEEYDVRLYHVGRLDRDTSGLLLLTNDGELAHRLTHPSYEVEKTYVAVVRGKMTGLHARKLTDGVVLDDGPAVADRVRIRAVQGNRSIVQITLHEGRNRIVRRMFDSINHPVLELSRIKLGPIALADLPSGKTRRLAKNELSALMACVGL